MIESQNNYYQEKQKHDQKNDLYHSLRELISKIILWKQFFISIFMRIIAETPKV